MRRKYIRPQSQAALWSPRFGLAAALLLPLTFILHRFGFILTADLPYFIAIFSFLAFISLFLAFCGLKSLWQEGAKGGLSCLKGCILALIALSPLFFALGAWFVFPPFHDISTDFEHAPEFLPNARAPDAVPIKAGFSAAEAEEQKEAWPQLSGRRYDGSPDTVLQAVYAVLKAENWPIIGQTGKAGEDSQILVQAAAKTFMLGFASDIIIRLTDEGDTSFVDMRAASRYLPYDYGINARFIDKFMSKLDSEILAAPAEDTGD